MRMQLSILILLCIAIVVACKPDNAKKRNASLNEKTASSKTAEPSKADQILDQAMVAHGGDLYDAAHYSFVFRNHTYAFKNEGGSYEYTKMSKDSMSLTRDVLKNDTFTRTINGAVVALTEKKIKSATEALNSVIYFATLPHKLKDESVQKTYVGETTISGKEYDVLGITFNKEGGGEDFDDAYHYWINTETNKIDYFAYNYTVNNGGVRFRSAYNRRVVDGITFQDYINYEADLGTSLEELPKLYETGKLKELSKIRTEDVINLKR